MNTMMNKKGEWFLCDLFALLFKKNTDFSALTTRSLSVCGFFQAPPKREEVGEGRGVGRGAFVFFFLGGGFSMII